MDEWNRLGRHFVDGNSEEVWNRGGSVWRRRGKFVNNSSLIAGLPSLFAFHFFFSSPYDILVVLRWDHVLYPLVIFSLFDSLLFSGMSSNSWVFSSSSGLVFTVFLSVSYYCYLRPFRIIGLVFFPSLKTLLFCPLVYPRGFLCLFSLGSLLCACVSLPILVYFLNNILRVFFVMFCILEHPISLPIPPLVLLFSSFLTFSSFRLFLFVLLFLYLVLVFLYARFFCIIASRCVPLYISLTWRNTARGKTTSRALCRPGASAEPLTSDEGDKAATGGNRKQ